MMGIVSAYVTLERASAVFPEDRWLIGHGPVFGWCEV